LKITKFLFLFIRLVRRKIYFLWFWFQYTDPQIRTNTEKKTCNSTREWKG